MVWRCTDVCSNCKRDVCLNDIEREKELEEEKKRKEEEKKKKEEERK